MREEDWGVFDERPDLIKQAEDVDVFDEFEGF